ncbi:MAG: SufD family Fe-S cluster assembly protein, partial [Clostridia bacterium]|nr:SufD family Fe-S cluster assembly protein [Clostridia bacterium]
MEQIEKNLLKEIADLHDIPVGAYNIRKNGESDSRKSTEHIQITQKKDAPGIDITILPGTKNESVHIPVILTQSGIKETVYNDFYIGEDSDVTIVAGCGIHNSGCDTSEHSGIHSFHVQKNATVRYVEKHYGQGEGEGKKVMNPTTVIYLEEGASMELETTQIGG